MTNLTEEKNLVRTIPPFRADHVGSFLRPQRLKEAHKAFSNQEITQTELRAIENAEIIQLVEQQKATGIQSITDGELRRSWWHIDFLEQLTGIEGYESETSYDFNGVKVRPYNIRVVGKVDFNPNHSFLEDFKFLKEAVGSEGTAKQTIPSPNMLIHDGIRNEAIYPNLDDYFSDLAKTYQKAIQAFYDVGCRYLQIDDTHWALLAAENKKELFEKNGVDPIELAKRCAATLNSALANKPADLVVTMHVCRGNFASSWVYSGGYEKIAESLFSVTVDGFFLEYDNERSGDFAPLRHITRHDLQIVLGLVTSKEATLEDKVQIKARIKEATEYVPLENLCLSPQCGFASTEEGNKISEEDQWAKLRHVVEISEEVWGN
ncbi:5-methyltetrahydropteroyltriglutamate--homocysteine methyltransferase [Carnobacterium maltaromaticum]|uniref:5-methyltetrahydropteroyltriglutamate-- homocysteine S-methyltransferase n=1 Tax=Carnobacterium maltaromaticum TaxID=2751 RepID=UPI000C75CB64|nr:5-methyltetrahydropteroyltriglutamate--homocysteine S-methyltransferase [Carnobacterium maltaromaticum]PLS37101.1 5-methyltetrahydropteroyltriglutamate--homocysteine methyltransferase [Carnobacterium maltaromaticum]PLS37915.1 5-methyltetrahydropteroyltriglutamate--homocysteine methyltransferase [Carnobacterium maltaromaticum]PLS39856.1 5-methyltetrahydropteroyltriglutamate--homocysteine methyltransferase [Carnobacterium maltaromaticum]PLS44612.1 5-methyltetrahydropteroyltriglutamate--homocys